MTAIAMSYTSEGFVVGADGRRVSALTQEPVSDNVQKILLMDHPKVYGIHAWQVRTSSTNRGGTFVFSEKAQEITKTLSQKPVPRLRDLVKAVGGEMYRQLLVQNGGPVINPKILGPKQVAAGLFVGYVDGRPQKVTLIFPHERGVLSPPLVEDFEVQNEIYAFAGPDPVLEEMGSVALPISVSESAAIVREYLQKCAEIAPKNIGGRMHVVSVGPSGVNWLDPPHTGPSS